MPAQLSLLADDREADQASSTGVRPKADLPARLSLVELDQAVAQYAERAHAQNTKRAYGADWKRFEGWCAQHGLQALPAEPRTLGRYLTALAEAGRKPSTIRRARIAVAMAHAWSGLERPDADPRIRLIERGIRRTRGVREQGPPPLLPEQLAAMVRALGRGPRAERDRAMLLLGFAAAFRRSELVAVRVEHLRFEEAGLVVFVPRSKEDPEGRGAEVFVPRAHRLVVCPVEAVRKWLARLAEDRGPVFVAVKDGLPTHTALNDATVRRVVQQAARRAGLDEAYSAHSLRGGFATAAHLAGQDDRVVQQQGRWRSVSSLQRYIRQARRPDSLL